jgi:hypothetical protein
MFYSSDCQQYILMVEQSNAVLLCGKNSQALRYFVVRVIYCAKKNAVLLWGKNSQAVRYFVVRVIYCAKKC